MLDTASGRPAAGVRVALEKDGTVIAHAVTDGEGRVSELAASLAAGRYRIVFELASGFFARVALDVQVGTEAHYHVPLLLSPFGLVTYRGS